MKLSTLLILTAGMLGSACGGDFCSKAESFDATSKKGTCSGVLLGNVSYTQASCEDDLKSCSSSDVSMMNDAIDCLDALPACQSGGEVSYDGSVVACTGKTQGLSSACKDAFPLGFVLP